LRDIAQTVKNCSLLGYSRQVRKGFVREIFCQSSILFSPGADTIEITKRCCPGKLANYAPVGYFLSLSSTYCGIASHTHGSSQAPHVSFYAFRFSAGGQK